MGMMRAQMNWIVAHKKSWNIAAVIGLGDIIENSSQEQQWEEADAAYGILDGTELPYIAALGNHDYDPAEHAIGLRLTTKYNQYFGMSRFAGRAWYGQDAYPAGKADNSYITFDAGPDKYLVISLEFFPREAALQWAESVLRSNPECRVIVVTHAYMGPDGSRTTSPYNWPPVSFGIDDGNDGEAVWSKLASQYPNIIAVVTGHSGGGINSDLFSATRVDRGVDGNEVAQMMSNYQWMAGGGNGFLRLLVIQPGAHRIVVRTFSPYLDQWMGDAANSFAVTLASAK